MSETLLNKLLAIEKSAWEANRTRNIDFYRSYLTDDCLGIFSIGIVDKNATLKDISENPRELFSYAIEEPRVLILSENVAVLIYKATVEGGIADQRRKSSALVTTIYKVVDGEWKAILHQQTNLIPSI